MMERPEYRLRVLAGFFLVENFKVQSSRTVIFDNLWKFTGISVKYKTQIGTNDHKLSKILFTQTDRLIMNYALFIMNYYRPQIYTDFHGFLISQPEPVTI